MAQGIKSMVEAVTKIDLSHFMRKIRPSAWQVIGSNSLQVDIGKTGLPLGISLQGGVMYFSMGSSGKIGWRYGGWGPSLGGAVIPVSIQYSHLDMPNFFPGQIYINPSLYSDFTSDGFKGLGMALSIGASFGAGAQVGLMLLGLEMSGADTGNWLAGDAGFRGIAFTGGMNVNFIPGPGASISGYYMYFSKRV